MFRPFRLGLLALLLLGTMVSMTAAAVALELGVVESPLLDGAVLAYFGGLTALGAVLFCWRGVRALGRLSG